MLCTLRNAFTHIINVMRKIKIQNRLKISFMFISIIPILVLGIFLYNKSIKAVHSKVSTYSMQIMDQVNENITKEIENYEQLAELIESDELVQEGINEYHNMDIDHKRELKIEIQDIISKKHAMINNVIDVIIYSMNDEVIYNHGYNTISNGYCAGIKEMIVKEKKSQVGIYAKTMSGNNAIVIGRAMYSTTNILNQIGYIYILVDESSFTRSTYKKIDMGGDAELCIINSNGLVISSATQDIKIGTTFKDNKIITKIKQNKKSDASFLTNIQNQEYMVSYSNNQVFDWYFISLISKVYLNLETKDIMVSMLIISLICVGVSIIFTTVIFSSISRPLKNLVQTIKKVTYGDLQVRALDDTNDEVGYLSQKVNHMLDQIQELIGQVENQQQLKRKAEIQMLQAQINPHFLFNTLNSLKWVAIMSQADSVSDGLGALAELLKNTIIHDNHFVTLREELDNVQHYIVIQKIRYGTLFDVIYDVDSKVMECQVLKFLLQPFVENSIIHGIEDSRKEGLIVISCNKINDSLRVIIKDNGKGIDEEKIKQILNKSHYSKHQMASIGISNVMERIKLNFGDEYGVNIESNDEGTKVIIYIPLIY